MVIGRANNVRFDADSHVQNSQQFLQTRTHLKSAVISLILAAYLSRPSSIGAERREAEPRLISRETRVHSAVDWLGDCWIAVPSSSVNCCENSISYNPADRSFLYILHLVGHHDFLLPSVNQSLSFLCRSSSRTKEASLFSIILKPTPRRPIS